MVDARAEKGKAWSLSEGEIQRAIAAYCSRQGSQNFDPSGVTLGVTADGILAIATPVK